MNTATLWTKKQVAKRLNMTVRGVEGLMVKRAIPFYRLGNRTVRFNPEDVEQWLERVKTNHIQIG